MPLSPREQLRAWIDGESLPPALEAEISPETIEAWKRQGMADEAALLCETGIVRIEESGVSFRKTARIADHAGTEEGACRLAEHYQADDPKRWPEDWAARLERWERDGAIVSLAGWHEGLFQCLGVRDADSLVPVLLAMMDCPERIERRMRRHREFILALLDRALRDFVPSAGAFYEAIASNHGPVISPAHYRRFAFALLREIMDRYRGAGIRMTFVRTAGAIESMLPVWLDAGIQGVYVNQTAAAGIDYAHLRRRFGERLLLLGGIDWRLVAAGPDAAGRLRERIRALAGLGRAIPYMDDSVRPYIRFDDFRRYREALAENVRS